MVAAIMCCSCSSAPAETEAPKLTAGEIAVKMQEAVNATPCTKLQTEIGYKITLDAGEMGTMELSNRTSTETTLSLEPLSGFTAAVSQVTMDGQTTQVRTESYLTEENGEIVSYNFANGIWLKQPTGQAPQELTGSPSVPEDVTLDETVTEWNGRSVICLTATYSGDQVNEALGQMLESIGQLGENLGAGMEAMDYSQLRADTRIYLDPETFLPLAEETILEGMTEMMEYLSAAAASSLMAD